MKHSLRSREAKRSFLYKNQWRSHCISSILQKLYIITACPCISSLRKPSLMQSFVERLMRYNNGDAVVDDIHASRDDMPLLSQWIKKSKSLNLDFLVWMNGLEPTTPCMSSKCSNQLSYTHIFTSLGYSITEKGDCQYKMVKFIIY